MLRRRTTGHELFTVGQRRGIGSIRPQAIVASNEPLYVLEKDAADSTVSSWARTSGC